MEFLKTMATAGVVLAAAAPLQAETWKMQTLWTSGSFSQQVIEDFADRVGEITDGEIEIQVYPVGAVVPFTETLEGVGRGILQAQHTGSVYFSGSEPAMALIGDLNGAYEDAYQLSNWFYYAGGLELAREAYAQFNLYYVGPVAWGMGSIPSKKRIETIEDFQGVKMRVVAGIGSELMTRLGASTVTMPGSEVFTSLDKGVVDATQWGTLSMNDDMGFHDVTSFQLAPGFYSLPAADFAVNLDTWNALSPDMQAQIEMAVRDLNYDMIARTRLADQEVMEKVAVGEIELIDWSEEERRKFREQARTVWKDWSEKSEIAKKIYDSHIAYLTDLGLID